MKGMAYMYNHHIDTFLHVARLGSLSKAAEELHLTPAAVGKHIDDLENIIGKKLLVRGVKGVKLTEQGSAFINVAPLIIKDSEKIIERIRMSGSDGVRPIRIGYFPLAPMDEFNSICLNSAKLRAFNISVIQYGASLGADRSEPEQVEIGFGVEESVENYPEIGFLPLQIVKLTCVVPARHRLAQKKELTYDDLAGETLYFPSRGNPGLTQRFCNEIRQNHPDIRVNAPSVFYDLEVINRCAAENVILVGFDAWTNIHPGLVNLPVDWPWEAPYGVIWQKNARKEVLDFMKAFKEAVAGET